ncbi:hypothetical protein GCM10007082_20520 [Oceanisphaera arctica]|nr:hypothetical protein GCM10007082_20520 [Oceanisphaera arctica]
MNKRYKVIRAIETSTASVHDSRHFEQVLDPYNTSQNVYADRGYASQAREADLRQRGNRPEIQRKGARNRPLSDC